MEKIITKKHQTIKDIFNIALFVLYIVVGTLLINTFLFRSFNVVGPSMERTLYTNDRLIINRLAVTVQTLKKQLYSPDRGQIIVFKNPNSIRGDSNEYLVKRVIAFASERVVVKNGKITVYNQQHPRGFNPDESPKNQLMIASFGDSVDEVIPKGHIFVSGDNRQESFDSRNGLGMVPLENITGPVKFRIYPFDRLASF